MSGAWFFSPGSTAESGKIGDRVEFPELRVDFTLQLFQTLVKFFVVHWDIVGCHDSRIGFKIKAGSHVVLDHIAGRSTDIFRIQHDPWLHFLIGDGSHDVTEDAAIDRIVERDPVIVVGPDNVLLYEETHQRAVKEADRLWLVFEWLVGIFETNEDIPADGRVANRSGALVE